MAAQVHWTIRASGDIKARAGCTSTVAVHVDRLVIETKSRGRRQACPAVAPGRLQSRLVMGKRRKRRLGRMLTLWKQRPNPYFTVWNRYRTRARPGASAIPSQAILRLTLLGLVSGQTTMAHIAWYGRLHWETLREPLGFGARPGLRTPPPGPGPWRACPWPNCNRQCRIGWLGWRRSGPGARRCDGKWAKQSTDVSGNPLELVNVLAHDLKLRLAQWPLAERRYGF